MRRSCLPRNVSLRATALVLAVLPLLPAAAPAQVENVPVTNQVYEFLDRLGVKGVLPMFSTASIPMSRGEVAALLVEARKYETDMTSAELAFLAKFLAEFAHDIGSAEDTSFVLIGEHASAGEFISGLTSDREKYLYAYVDTSVSLYAELLGSLDLRTSRGDTWGTTRAVLGSIGGRFRGTALNKLGYLLQATNGRLWGDKEFALSDPHLAGNVKFNELGAPYFDFTEAYLKLKLDWFDIQFGKEFRTVGLGYSDKLELSGNAPAFDFLELGVHYKSFRFTFIHGTVVQDSSFVPGLLVVAPPDANKYLALHRFQFSLFDVLNFSAGEMVIYQRLAPEFAYLNPINFFKSAEHQLGDKDNAFLIFDVEVFPFTGYKFYGTWLIDDIDFSKLGTGWWGNQFGWQGGGYAADVAGIRDLDAVLEYARIEPYVYSNRIAGNDYTQNSIPLGHSLPPNSDQWMLEARYRPAHQLRLWLSYFHERHGDNVIAGDSVLRNVGGSIPVGHRPWDATSAPFLDGVRTTTDRVRAKAEYEPIPNLFLLCILEYRNATATEARTDELLARAQVRIEY